MSRGFLNKCPGLVFQKLVCPGGILSLLFYGGVFLLSGIAHLHTRKVG